MIAEVVEIALLLERVKKVTVGTQSSANGTVNLGVRLRLAQDLVAPR